MVGVVGEANAGRGLNEQHVGKLRAPRIPSFRSRSIKILLNALLDFQIMNYLSNHDCVKRYKKRINWNRNKFIYNF